MQTAPSSADEPTRQILVVEHATCQRGFYQVILDWVDAHVPECSACFDLQVLGEHLAPQPHHTLVVPWLQDPVQAWSAEAYRQAVALTQRCDAATLPVINRVERLVHASKSTGAQLMRDAGLRTPRHERISHIDAFRRDFLGLRLPLMVREDWGHGSLALPSPRRLGAAGHGHVGLAAALAAHLLGHKVDQLTSLDLAHVCPALTVTPSSRPVCTLSPSTTASTMAAVLSLSLSLSMVSRRVLASAPVEGAASTLTPLTSTAWLTSSSPWAEASLPLSAATSFSSALDVVQHLANAALAARPPAP
jgi:hypothetical protein